MATVNRNMRRAIEYLKEALALLEGESDAQRAEQLGIQRSTLSKYQLEKRVMDNYSCVIVANILGIDPMLCICSASYENEKSDEKKQFWLDLWNEINARSSETR